MKYTQEIIDLLSKLKIELNSNYPIKNLAIFGSYSTSEQNIDSNLDLLVDFSDIIGIRFIDLANTLEKRTGLKLDLVSKNGVKPEYFKSIEKDLIYV